MRLFLPFAFALLAAAPAWAGGHHNEGRGFDPSGPDAAMLEAANEAGHMVNTNQATISFQTEWYKTHDQNGNLLPGVTAPEPKKLP